MQIDWVLNESVTRDVDVLMRWLDNEMDVLTWGGPAFRYPFNRHSFTEDLYWGRLGSYSLRDQRGEMAAFGQLYERLGRVNLARLITDPLRRGSGIGKQLIAHLMQVGRNRFHCDEFSLFVYRDNRPALRCYEALGFEIKPYPRDVEFADICYYLTRPVDCDCYKGSNDAP
ncbi:MAG: GNAT family N-acetyltransferase [Gammaproteobacteria bacterium]|nr:GNAT family N-acetyltransferase [Gammaproteobacteria bacterium]